MSLTARPVAIDDISPWRDFYRAEMNCQIVHDNMHYRPGWAEPYLLEVDGAIAGYGSILVGGPWKGTRTLFEFYVIPPERSRVFELFAALLEAGNATAMEIQSNDPIITVMLHTFGHGIAADRILFEDSLKTSHRLTGIALRHRDEPHNDWAIEAGGEVAAWGGILYHYNRPYGDIYMEVAAPFRRRGFGTYLVQELKRICYEGGSIPAARCNPDNIASRRTLQKAGLVPCATILTGRLERTPRIRVALHAKVPRPPR
jgi:GNAT superfamily N-acetyltransferase